MRAPMYPMEPAGLGWRAKHRYRNAIKQGLSHEDALKRVAAAKTGRPRKASLDVQFEQDELALAALEESPYGLSLDRIAELYGASKELIRRTEITALQKLRGRINPREFAYLAERSVA